MLVEIAGLILLGLVIVVLLAGLILGIFIVWDSQLDDLVFSFFGVILTVACFACLLALLGFIIEGVPWI